MQERGLLLLTTLFVLLIFAAGLWSVGRQTMIFTPDDFGYWGMAAQWAGYDWSDSLASSNYYSFGYSIVLFPLYLLSYLGVGTTALYRLALIINACFLVLSFFLTVHVGRRLLPQLNKYFLLTISFATTLYVSNVWHAATTLAETYLYLMYWCLVVCMLRLLERFSSTRLILLLLVTANLFIIHMRSLGVVIAVIITLLLYFLLCVKNISYKKLLLFLGIAILITIAVVFSVNMVTNHIYQGNTGTNTFAAQVRTLRRMLSFAGIIDFILSYMGKLFYVGASSFLLVFLSLTMMASQVLGELGANIRKKSSGLSNQGLFGIFLLLSFLSTVAVSAAFKIFFATSGRTSTNADTILYGRYTEFVIGPLLLLGFAMLVNIRKHLKELVFSLALLFLCAIGVQRLLDILTYHNPHSNLVFRASGVIGLVWLSDGRWNNFAYYAAGIAVLIFATIAFILSLNTKEKVTMFMTAAFAVAMSVFWIYQGVVNLQIRFNNYISREQSVVPIVEIVEQHYPDHTLYLVTSRSFPAERLILQWLLPEKTLRYISIDEIGGLGAEPYVLLSSSLEHRIAGQLASQYYFLYDSGVLRLFSTDDVPDIEDIRSTPNPFLREIDLASVTTDYSVVGFNGKLSSNYSKPEGYLTQGLNVFRRDGIYEVVIDMEVSGMDGSGDLGYIETSIAGYAVQETRAIKREDFSRNGKATISVALEVADYGEFTVGVYSYGNSALQITGMKYNQLRGNGIAGLFAGKDSLDELEELGKIYRQSDVADKSLIYVDSDYSGSTGFPDYSLLAPYFGDQRPAYITGELLPYMTQYRGTHMLVEKTNGVDAVIELLDGHSIVGESQNYFLYALNPGD